MNVVTLKMHILGPLGRVLGHSHPGYERYPFHWGAIVLVLGAMGICVEAVNEMLRTGKKSYGHRTKNSPFPRHPCTSWGHPPPGRDLQV